MSQLHALARTTLHTRTEIKESSASLAELAKRYNVCMATVRKWKSRDSQHDLSNRPHKLCTTLTPAQEAIVVEVRCLTLLPLDDLMVVVRELINSEVSRSGLDRCLRRHGVANLRELHARALADAGEVQAACKTLKDCEPGFFQIVVKHLPQMPDESKGRYLFVAIDRATRWVFMHIYSDESAGSGVDFLNLLERTAPMKITKLLTPNDTQFTRCPGSKTPKPTERHPFNARCKALNIVHRLCSPHHPPTAGVAACLSDKISEVVDQTQFNSAAELETTLKNHVKTYNRLIPQRALRHVSPVQALKNWQAQKPELFKDLGHEMPAIDT